MKLGGQCELVTLKKCFDFGEDPILDPISRIFLKSFFTIQISGQTDIYQDISKSCGQTWTKLSGQVGCVAQTN